MRLKPIFWSLLSLLFFAAAIWLWHIGDRRAASRHDGAVSTGKSVGSGGSDRSDGSNAPATTAPAAGPRTYRLSNTAQPLAQLERNNRAILLRNALIDTSLRVTLPIPEHLKSHGAPGSYLVQSDRPLNGEFYAALRRDGAEFVSYIPNNTALVRASEEAARKMVADRLFQAVLPYEPYFKLDGALLPAAVNGEALTNNNLRVTALPGQEAAAEQALAALGANVTSREATPFGSTTLYVTAPADQLAAVARLPQTQEIESFSPRHKLNDLSRVRLAIATNTITTNNYLGLTGSNIWMALDDTGVDQTLKDFSPTNTRLMATDPAALTDPDGHGTFVAATMAGGGNESATVTNGIPGSITPTTNLFRGMAPLAGLFVQQVDLWTGPFISDAYLQSNASYVMTTNAVTQNSLHTNNVFLTNGFVNNLSVGYQSTVYDLPAASYDQATRNSQYETTGEHAMLFVVAAGNGNNGTGTILSPATAKNVISVGAIDSPRYVSNLSETYDSNTVAQFSSGGNVGAGIESEYGRFKPDVVAPGVFTVSARATGYQDPTAQEVLAYASGPGESVAPGQTNVYTVNLVGVMTNLIVQLVPNELSPVPFPTNLTLYFDANDPPTTLPATTNAAGLPEWLNPATGDNYLAVSSPSNQPWPVNFDVRVYAIGTNNDYSTYYQSLSNWNTNLSPYYRYESGTSIAAAAVSGMLGLMQDYLHNTMKLTPSPALLKALLINGARPLNRDSDLNPAPAVNLEGYGLPCLTNSIPATLSNSITASSNSCSMRFYDQSNALQTGESHTYTVTLADNATNYPLRVTLVWTDPPGNPAAGLALVNNLDLEVTDSTTTNVFVGNDFNPGDIYTEASSSTNLAASDTVNNVENVYLDASLGLTKTYTITVKGTSVNVNADTTQTNIIGQDYALVISSDDTADGLTVTDNGTNMAAAALITTANNGIALLNQRAGANEPNGTEYPGALYPAPGSTNGDLTQWHFFLFTNINYLTNQTTNTDTNSMFFNSGGTNIAQYFTNAIFATFLPATLAIPDSSPVNESYPAAQNADIELYVSTNPALFNLDPNAIAGAAKSLGQGGSETVLFTNIASVSNFYVGVKCETQQGADFDFFATLATNFDNGGLNGGNGNSPITVSAYGLPVTIPDSFDTGGPEGAEVLAFVATPMTVRKVQVTLGIQHENPADLYGTLTHAGQSVVLNHYTGAPVGFTNTYDDLPEGETNMYPIVPSDGPGSLRSFVGRQGNGQWLLNEKDSVFTQTGMVTMLTLTIWPQPPLASLAGLLNAYTNVFTLGTNGVYYGIVDVPNDATNMEIGVIFTNGGPVGIYLTNQEVPTPGDYGTNISVPGQYLSLGLVPPTNGPPLSGGLWYFMITNASVPPVTMTITNFILIWESGTPNLALTVFSAATPTPLATDAHTLSQICVTNGILSSNQQLASVQVGVCVSNTGVDGLVINLISPQGTGTELFDSRGGPLATNVGLVTTNGGYIYFTFADNPYLAPDLVKFFPPPYGELLTNVSALDSSFETVSAGDYGLSNALLPNVLGTGVEVWTVVSNDVAVVDGEGLYSAGNGTNYLALATGQITTGIPTIPGQAYTLTFNYRGPGLVDWWPLDGDYNDIIGTNNGTLTAGGPVTNVEGEVGLGVQFPSSFSEPLGANISFGTNAGNFGTNDFTIDYWMNMVTQGSVDPKEAFLEKRPTCDATSSFWGIRMFIMDATGRAPTLEICRGSALPAAQAPAPLSLSCTRPVNDGLWHHFAWVRSGVDMYLYVDGVLNNQAGDGTLYYVSNNVPLNMGTAICENHDATVPFTGAVDELDLWNRALTDVEIAAIYQAGTNHAGKATPASILPNCQVVISTGSDTETNTLIAPASGTNWLTNMVYFNAINTNTSITIQGNPLSMLLDDFVMEMPANLNYVQPEEPLAPLIGQNPYGCWTLDVWDARNNSSSSNNGVLLSWDLQMTVSSTNTSLIVLTNHVPYIAGTVPPYGITYFGFDVTNGVGIDTNLLLNCSTNLSLLFNQDALPVGNQLGDYTLLTNVINGTNMLEADTPPPSFMPGARYFLGVQNTNSVAATFTIRVDTQNLTNISATVQLADAFPYSTNIAAAPQYYSFVVPSGAVLASFEIINPTNELDLYARHTLPLPSSTTYDYHATYNGTNDEAIVVSTNSALAFTTNSEPVPLTPGIWYLAVYNYNTNKTVYYQVEAAYILAGSINITPLTNAVAAAGTNGPGPDLTNFYSFTVTNPAAAAVQFTVSNMTGNVDLIANLGSLPTPGQMTDGSFNLQTNTQLVTIVTNSLQPVLYGTTWYLGVPNNTANNVSFLIAATTLTNAANLHNFPAVVMTGLSVSASQFTLSWSSVPGAQYNVNVSSDLINWTNAATVTTGGYTGSYSEPVVQQNARFYQVIPNQ